MPTATVHAWNDTGWRHDGAHARLIAFDLDNTLAVSKQPMKPDMTVRIEALTELMPVAIVTGGGRELVISQVLDVLDPRADLSNLHVMPAGGSSYYRWREGAWRLEYERTLSARDRDAAILSLTRRARELGMWPEHPWGESIGHLRVRAGGYTSVDVSAGNTDKAFALRELAGRLGISTGDIIFVGDRMTPGGNDYPAAQAGAIALQVTGPQDTVRLCDILLPLLGGEPVRQDG